ncbi:MAG: hypothetical protein ACRDTA_21335 [Pseudonocardiaceae bacterium]
MDHRLPTDPERPDPDGIRTRLDFGNALTLLREHVGLSIRELAARLEEKGHVRVPSTLGGWFAGNALPAPSSQGLFVDLLRECGIHDSVAIDHWLLVWRRLRVPTRRQNGAEPYRGLASFGVDDADWFFGRDSLTDELLDQVRAMHAAGGGVLMVVGSSGSGKSSLLHAGVVPALGKGALPRSETWPTLSLTPTRHPIDELARCLAAQVGIDASTLAKSVREDSATCGTYARRAALADHCGEVRGDVAEIDAAEVEEGDELPGGRRLVLIVDQFEQVFTACPDEDERQLFIAALCAAAAEPNGALVVVGLRADFYDPVLRYPQLLTAVRERQITVGPMSEIELREVITHPADKAKIKIEEGLVELLLGEVCPRRASGAGVLPLLSHALYATWEKGQGRRLTITDYQQVGGIDRAVAASAEKVYAELTAGQQDLTRRMFVSLVHVHSDAADTHRRVPLEELLGELLGDGDGDELDGVLERFIAERLITIDADTVEITHEALMTAWPTFREWLDTDRNGLLLAQQIKIDAHAWDDDNREQAALYRGTKLAAARNWAAEHRNELPDTALEFLDTSHRYARRRTRRLYHTIIALGMLLVLTVTFGVVAWEQRASAVQERDEALSRMMATRANQLRGKDVSLARQLSLVAYRIAPTAEARSSLLDASAVRPAVRMRGGDGIGIMPAAAFHPAGTTLAAAADNTVRLWDIAEPGHPRPLQQLPTTPDARVYALAFPPDGQLLAAACADATIRIWDIRQPATPVQLPPLTGLGGTVYSVAFSPNGQMLAAASSDGTVRLWRVSGVGQPIAVGLPMRVDGGAAKSVSFHVSNQFLAVGSEGGTVQLWDITDPMRPAVTATLTEPTKAIGQVAFSPDGRMLAAGSADFAAYLWNVTDLRAPRPWGPPLDGAMSWINAVAFSPDSTSLAVASSDAARGVRVFDLATTRITATLPHPAPVTAVKFSPDGKTIVTGANDGTARLWPLAAPTLDGMAYVVSATRFSPDGRTLAVGSADTRLWNVTDPQQPTPYGPALTNPDSFAGTLAFTPDSRTLAAGHGGSGTLQLWNVTDPARPVPFGPPLPAHQQQIESLGFNPDGRLLATGSRDAAVRLWDVSDPATPVLRTTLTGFSGYISWVAFSPDGRLLVTASTGKTIQLWNVTDPAHPTPVGQPVKSANHYVYSAVFSPDGQLLAVSSADSTIRLFDLTKPAQPRLVGAPLTGPTNSVYSVSFNTDGTTLAAAATDSTVWLWDLHQRDKPTPIATLTVPTDAVYTVDFYPHRSFLVAGGASKTAWLWHTDPEQAAAHICATTGDPITPDEWAKHVPRRPYQPPCRI